ncbi:MAG: chorismate mutase [Gemmatimonadaceae bacterium]
MRAIRGATTVAADRADLLGDATRELIGEIVRRNALAPADVISAIFTVTDDLRSDFPARAARALGWADVPLLCTVEIPVSGALARCIRVLLHVESARARDAIVHVYLRDARALRPDLAGDDRPR